MNDGQWRGDFPWEDGQYRGEHPLAYAAPYAYAPALAYAAAPAYAYAAPAVVAAPLGATSVTATRGSVHVAPLPGHTVSQQQLNLAPAPGTL